jgi:hypothetical protein
MYVAGESQFHVGGGSISITTPGGWPGVIAYAPNGHRRDIQFYNDHTAITISDSSSASHHLNGIQIKENGNVGIGTSSPQERLHVAGNVQVKGVKFPDGTIQKTAGMPTRSQILPASERFVLVLGTEAVLDRETGLVWERTPHNMYNSWSHATRACHAQIKAGRKGWRLPRIEELQSLVDPSQEIPALPSGHPFSDVLLNTFPEGIFYWTHTTSADDHGRAYVVDFNYGGVWTRQKGENHPIWCVRGGHGTDGW